MTLTNEQGQPSSRFLGSGRQAPPRSIPRVNPRKTGQRKLDNATAETLDSITRVRNLRDFDPRQKMIEARDRARVIRALLDANKQASVIATIAAKDATKMVINVKWYIEELVAAARRAEMDAVKIAWRARDAAFERYELALVAIGEELERQRRIRAAEAAFDASVVASRAATGIQVIHDQLLPVMMFIEEETNRILMEDIQKRVMELIVEEPSTDCPSIEINLVQYEIKLKEQIQFEGGKAVIKEQSFDLLNQIVVCKKCITRTCKEFDVPNMHWKVQGHTAKSKKSTDGGMATSDARAKAVCDHLGRRGTDINFLHPEGCGCYHPPADPKADPRRVEIHVLKQSELDAMAKQEDAKLAVTVSV